jgi:hypothetical protein
VVFVQIPQRLPVLQLAEERLYAETELAPEIFEANVEIFFLTCWLPQHGHTTSSTALALRTSSSNGSPHSEHSNSNNGMHTSLARNL